MLKGRLCVLIFKPIARIRLIAALVLGLMASPTEGAPDPHRLALVIGEAGYVVGALPTTANDAGVVAQSLVVAGFDVTGYANLDAAAMRQAFTAFVAKANAAGPETEAVVYLSGYGVQFDGDNYVVPVEARLARDIDVPTEAVRLSDFTKGLEGTALKARVFAFDLARATPFAKSGPPLASGLALVAPAAGSVFAYNAAPGTVAGSDPGHYGLYALAFAEMMQVKGLPLPVMLSRVRARVTALTGGAAVPWNDGTLELPFAFFPPASDALAIPSRTQAEAVSADDAFWTAVMDDTLPAYAEALGSYPDDPLSSRLRALLAVRREALTFAQTLHANSADAYWTYMRRYPRGPHFADARRRLAALPAALEPPPRFDVFPYADLPAPRAEERTVFDQPVVSFNDEDYASVQAPPTSIVPPRRMAFYDRLPPLLAVAARTLPLPLPIPPGFTSPLGQITQPDTSGHDGPVIATVSFDKAGLPTVLQTGPGGKGLSTASETIGQNGVRTVTQTGPDGQPVSSIVETTGPDGGRTVIQTGPNKQIIATMSTKTEPNGNRTTTLFGLDRQPRSILTTTPNGMILKSRGAAVSATAITRPVLLEARAPAQVASPKTEPAPVPTPSSAAPIASAPSSPTPSQPAQPQSAPPPPAPAVAVSAPAAAPPSATPSPSSPPPTSQPPSSAPAKPLVAPVAPLTPKPVTVPVAPILTPVMPMTIPAPTIREPIVPSPTMAEPAMPTIGPMAPFAPPAMPKMSPLEPPSPPDAAGKSNLSETPNPPVKPDLPAKTDLPAKVEVAPKPQRPSEAAPPKAQAKPADVLQPLPPRRPTPVVSKPSKASDKKAASKKAAAVKPGRRKR